MTLYFRNLTDGQWYSFNDQHVSKVGIETAVWLSLLFPQLQCFLVQGEQYDSFLLRNNVTELQGKQFLKQFKLPQKGLIGFVG